jgi:hypothetical protein
MYSCKHIQKHTRVKSFVLREGAMCILASSSRPDTLVA